MRHRRELAPTRCGGTVRRKIQIPRLHDAHLLEDPDGGRADSVAAVLVARVRLLLEDRDLAARLRGANDRPWGRRQPQRPGSQHRAKTDWQILTAQADRAGSSDRNTQTARWDLPGAIAHPRGRRAP